jgi:ABC-type nitrate/sulfonate/bicarbonate transport system substrate-binding protein
MMKRKLLIVCLMIFVLGVFPAEGKEYTVALGSYYGFAPFVVGYVKGFFAKEGFPLNAKYYLSLSEWFNAVLYDRVNISLMYHTSQIEFLYSGKNMVFLGAIAYEHENHRLVIKSDLSPQDFTTQKVGMNVDSLGYRWLVWEYVKSENIRMADINVVVLSNEDLLKNFLAERLNIVILPGNLAMRAVEEGNGVVVTTFSPQQSLFGIVMPKDIYDAVPSADLKNMYLALIKAIRWIEDPANTEELFAILQEKFPEPTVSDFTSREGFEKSRSLVSLIKSQELYDYNHVLLKDSYDNIKLVAKDLGKPYNFSYHEIVDTSILLEVLEEMGLADKPATAE